MAERAANIYFTSEAKPSLFEILAQQSLNATLQPALQKFTEFLATSKPNYFGLIHRYYDESFAIFNGLLQYHYFKNYGASFSENFYGLKRLTIDDYELSASDKILSWTCYVVLPYVKSKIDSNIENYKLQHAEDSLKHNRYGTLIKYLLYLHSSCEAFWSSWMLLNYLRYMADQTDHQLPILRLLELKLTYSSEIHDTYSFWVDLFKGVLSFGTMRKGILQNFVRGLLEMSAFFVQFLQVWNTEQANFNISALPKVPLPESKEPNSEKYYEKCPICLKPWKIPTVLPISGYVFCFACILNYLRENSCCPVTNLPVKALDIIRLYDND